MSLKTIFYETKIYSISLRVHRTTFWREIFSWKSKNEFLLQKLTSFFTETQIFLIFNIGFLESILFIDSFSIVKYRFQFYSLKETIASNYKDESAEIWNGRHYLCQKQVISNLRHIKKINFMMGLDPINDFCSPKQDCSSKYNTGNAEIKILTKYTISLENYVYSIITFFF